MDWIEKAIENLLIRGQGEIFTRIETIGLELEIDGTEAKAYCYGVKLDAQGNPRVNDLIEFVTTKLVDYSIPKKLQDEAKEQLNNTGSTSKIIELNKKAKLLFTDLEKTGEFGELLLYILVQEILELPQLISKMSLKTSGQLHYQGADGIHVKYDKSDDSLSLYWGESKMEQTIYSGLRNCFESLKLFLLDTYGHDSTQTRDLQLITSNISENINNPDLEDILVRYFDLDDDLSNKLKYKGICFVGFDSNHYPSSPFEKTTEVLIKAFQTEMSQWLETSGKQIKKHVNLEKFEIHLFLIPFPSVQEFRTRFLKAINK
jgi:Cap4 SAVED domain